MKTGGKRNFFFSQDKDFTSTTNSGGYKMTVL